MKDELLNPLANIVNAAQSLISDDSESVDDPLQQKYVHAIHDDAVRLYDLVVSFPDLTWQRVREMLNYEARSHLASIIGYAEILLDEVDGPLTDNQRQLVHYISTNGKHLLNLLSDLQDKP